MALNRRQVEFSHALGLLLIHIAEKGFWASVREVGRTIEKQRENVKAGVSWTLDSRHIDFLAADLILFNSDFSIVTDNEAYRQFGEYWESSLNGRWGGRFGLEDQPKAIQDSKLGKDVYHFEYRKVDISAEPPH